MTKPHPKPPPCPTCGKRDCGANLGYGKAWPPLGIIDRTRRPDPRWT